MNKKEITGNVIIGLLVAAIIGVLIAKFVLVKEPRFSFDIREQSEVEVRDLEGNPTKFVDLLPSNDVIYCLLFDERDCTSCVIKGLADMKELRRDGKRTIILAMFNLIGDLRGWANVNECQDVFMLKKAVFYDHFFCQTTPVMIRIKNGSVDAFKYIIP